MSVLTSVAPPAPGQVPVMSGSAGVAVGTGADAGTVSAFGVFAVSRRVQLAVLLGALLVMWHSLGDHSLYPPDEGRYGSVSAAMAESGRWLEPQIRETLHVTKPPFTYWAQAAAIKVLGHSELAVRLPSVLAATAVLLSLFWFVRRTCGALAATLAAGLYAVMPLPLVVGRLATTDSLLNAWWWLALVAGYMAVETRARAAHRWWAVAFWVAVALVGLTKGPLILAPVVLMAAWAVLGRRWRDLRALHGWAGLPLALLPLAGVAYLYWSVNPDATAAIWKMEFVDRLTGEGVHHDPLLEFVPAFFVGFFPASVALLVPGLHLSFRQAWACFRAGDLRALMLIAVTLPFIGFSLLAGKQLTYILPLAAPLAILAALSLRRWLPEFAPAGTHSLADLPAPRLLPEFRRIAAVAICVAGIGTPIAAVVATRNGWIPPVFSAGTLVLWSASLLPAMVGFVACAVLWNRPRLRAVGLACAFLGMVTMWTCVEEVEDDALEVLGARPLAQSLVQRDHPVMACILRDLTIDFYMGRWSEFTWNFNELPAWLDEHPGGVVLMTRRDFAAQSADHARPAAHLRIAESFVVWPLKEIVVLEKREGG